MGSYLNCNIQISTTFWEMYINSSASLFCCLINIVMIKKILFPENFNYSKDYKRVERTN